MTVPQVLVFVFNIRGDNMDLETKKRLTANCVKAYRESITSTLNKGEFLTMIASVSTVRENIPAVKGLLKLVQIDIKDMFYSIDRYEQDSQILAALKQITE